MSALMEDVEIDEPIVRTKKEKKESNKTKKQPPYSVIIFNDDDHTFQYVTLALQKVFGYDLYKAMSFTIEIHEKGKALVWSGSREVAELKKEQIESIGPDLFAEKKVEFPLNVSIEPMA